MPPTQIAALRRELDRLMADEHDGVRQAAGAASLALLAVQAAREHGAIGPTIAGELIACLQTILVTLGQVEAQTPGAGQWLSWSLARPQQRTGRR